MFFMNLFINITMKPDNKKYKYKFIGLKKFQVSIIAKTIEITYLLSKGNTLFYLS